MHASISPSATASTPAPAHRWPAPRPASASSASSTVWRTSRSPRPSTVRRAPGGTSTCRPSSSGGLAPSIWSSHPLPRSAAFAVAGAVALLMAAVGVSSTPAGAGKITRRRPAGPSAAFSDISGGNGVFLGDPVPVNLKRAGYVEHEYAASGTATSYTATSPLTEDGRWSFAPEGSAPYRTRVLVRRPIDRARFSGRVVV